MNNINYLKLNYWDAIYLILIFIICELLSNILLNLFLQIFPFIKTIFLLLIFEYIFPFILFFKYFFYKNSIKSLKRITKYKIFTLNIYINMFLLIISIIIINEYIVNIIPKKNFFLKYLYYYSNYNLKKLFKYPITFFISSVLLAPFCEEIFFRGILLNGLLRNKISPIKAILFSSFLFGFIHMNPFQSISAFISGIFIGFIYLRTYSILLCIFLHGLNNVLIFFLLFFNKEKKLFQWIQLHNYMKWIIFIFLIYILYSFFLRQKKYFK